MSETEDKPDPGKKHGDLDRFVWTGDDITVRRKKSREAGKETAATMRADDRPEEAQ